MTFRSILALADAEAEDAETLAFAIALARDHAAAVSVFPAMSDITGDLIAMGVAMGAPYTPDVQNALDEARAEQMESIRNACRAASQAAGVPFGDAAAAPGVSLIDLETKSTWLTLSQTVALSDLCLAGQKFLDSAAHMSGVLSDLLLNFRAPVLVARGAPDALGETVTIAWDGSREAGRAVRAGLPMIERARRVVVLQCASGLDALETDPAPQPLLRYLALHGIADVEVETVAEGPEGQALIAAARGRGAAILVAGAYGHSRFSEAVFGGATRAFLEAKDGPSLLLAH